MSVTVQTWHWLVDEKLIGSKECHNLRPSLTRHLTSTSCKNKQKQACATRNDLVDLVAEEWSQQKSYTFKISQHGVSRTDTNKHHTCNKNKSQSQHTSPHISTHLHTSPHISTHLHTSPHISTPWRWQQVRLGCQRTWGRAWERALQEIWSIQELCIPLPQTWRSWNTTERLLQKSQKKNKCTQHYIALHCTTLHLHL